MALGLRLDEPKKGLGLKLPEEKGLGLNIPELEEEPENDYISNIVNSVKQFLPETDISKYGEMNKAEIAENIAKAVGSPIGVPLTAGASAISGLKLKQALPTLFPSIEGVAEDPISEMTIGEILQKASGGASGALTLASTGDIQEAKKAIEGGKPFAESAVEAGGKFIRGTLGEEEAPVPESASLTGQLAKRIPETLGELVAEFIDPQMLPTIVTGVGIAKGIGKAPAGAELFKKTFPKTSELLTKERSILSPVAKGNINYIFSEIKGKLGIPQERGLTPFDLRKGLKEGRITEADASRYDSQIYAEALEKRRVLPSGEVEGAGVKPSVAQKVGGQAVLRPVEAGAKPDFKAIAESQGGTFSGIQEVREPGKANLVQVDVPGIDTTLAIPENEFTPETLERRIMEKKEEFRVAEGKSESLEDADGGDVFQRNNLSQQDIDTAISIVEKEQKLSLNKAQKEAIKNLHKIAEPKTPKNFATNLEKQILIRKIKELQQEKNLSSMTTGKIKKAFNIQKLKKTDSPKLQELAEYIQTLEPGDSFLSDNQKLALKEILKDVKDVDLTPRRILIDKFGEKTDLLTEGSITGKIANELFPTVDIKEGHPLITRVADKADALIDTSIKEVQRRNDNFGKMLKKARKERNSKLKFGEQVMRSVVPGDKEIFRALSGESVDLTPSERAVVAYLKNFFEKVKNDPIIDLKKARKHYVPHLEKGLMEKIVDKGLYKALQETFSVKGKENIPVDIMLELDNIIGSKKFFKFALERKGYGKPTTDLARILNEYSNIYETKRALDQILPEGQAIVQLFLKPKSAKWTKKFLQNLKGRGLDNEFRTGKMAWLTKVADGILDAGYLKLLGLNYWSALKNLTAGETNTWIFEGFGPLLLGKKRFISNPKKAMKIISDTRIIDGAFAEYLQQGLGGLKKAKNLAFIGQKAGESMIRGVDMVLGKMTEAEWNSGNISVERLREMKNDIAITQGLFSKVDSPLFVQTWFGRAFMQMNRWRITNTLLLRRMAKGAKQEWSEGQKAGPNSKRLARSFIAYGIGMYMSYELGKSGYRKAAQVAQSMAEVINSTIETATLKPIVQALTDNPSVSILKELTFSIQELANYIGVPGAEPPRELEFQQGIEDTYIAAEQLIPDE